MATGSGFYWGDEEMTIVRTSDYLPVVAGFLENSPGGERYDN